MYTEETRTAAALGGKKEIKIYTRRQTDTRRRTQMQTHKHTHAVGLLLIMRQSNK